MMATDPQLLDILAKFKDLAVSSDQVSHLAVAESNPPQVLHTRVLKELVFAVDKAAPVELRKLLRTIAQDTRATDLVLVPSDSNDDRDSEVVADVEEGPSPFPKEKWKYPPRKQEILDRKAQYIDRQRHTPFQADLKRSYALRYYPHRQRD
jgi:hypothetical protein